MNTTTGIEIGSLVGLKKFDTNPDTQLLLNRWIGAYGRGPFEVFGMVDDGHVSLKYPGPGGKEIHFGSTANLSLHIGFVELWK
ncbi:MAG: hypothetical protein A3E02_01645 [Candidatus Zambryskibacteria bacterium RIFCSPHIGHO2_12_FULL_38_34]|uniref:Uncharacterized protein n=1 Tax=Candidatus Zambryskibacteria bacterium RIFCSPLOWO2_12_FULL_39_16 TaxID=1802775 RepID=A0A1G2UU01_9BACT|nr:MAG: hypothetical protein A3D37_02305 [Candidatus Zambryskibacteria bacterium RIFCSPHIGHO2_02_FULL_38_22]OHA98532.1 MAG: hypothetical protein A3E02_01645 [Candidatus Zambryskibacteria bacterium RIFCSPHIGHO2_12_FULL_38_34]OHB12880.1 MAG: hypothetical protein A3G46_02585 [Candidatus Zambryskibacteria bacterium RIFCSPLOWO2_12_FULL_39_16]